MAYWLAGLVSITECHLCVVQVQVAMLEDLSQYDQVAILEDLSQYDQVAMLEDLSQYDHDC